MNRLLAAVVALMLIGGILIVLSAVAQAANVERGRAYARSHCARCHAIDEKSASPLAIAPPFRTLHERYPVESLAEAPPIAKSADDVSQKGRPARVAGLWVGQLGAGGGRLEGRS
jgi:cytochrome c553